MRLTGATLAAVTLLLMAPAYAAAAPPRSAAPPAGSGGDTSVPTTDSMAEVVVEGRHEGPRLWRVRQGDHLLWILGTVSPLPKKLVWQPDAVEAVLKQTQEVIPAWPSYGIGANPITALRVYIQWRRIQKPPDHMSLRETLPPELYARVKALQARYDPHDNTLEQLRPMLAAERLLFKVLDASGLTVHNEVQARVLELARAAGVRVRQDKLKIDDPVDVLKDVGAAPLSGEIACLETVVTRLETDLVPMQQRARAWALGDVDTLRALPHTDNRTACVAAVSTSERVRSLIERAEQDWLVSVQQALQRNRGTLAVQSMDRLLGEHGALALLKAHGYEVEGP